MNLVIASVPDRDGVVAEIWLGDAQVAELSTDSGPLRLELYLNPSGQPWRLDYEEFIEMLTRAKERLLSGT